MTLTLDQFNQLPLETARAELLRCCGSQAWADGMLAARPFASLAELYVMAGNFWWLLTEADWREAFDHHPQIGDIENLRQKFARSGYLSEQEQAGVQGASEEILQALAQGNVDYEAKFGYIFIVCATGKSAAEMLAILQSRLPNESAEEFRVASEEQRKISFLRLESWLGGVEVWRHIAIVALHGADGRWALQLRDDFTYIAWPNRWGMFGGGIEGDEDARTAAVREVAEELEVTLDPKQLRYGFSYIEQKADQYKILHVFYAAVTNELDHYVLHEGQKLGWVTTEQIEGGTIEDRAIAPHHRDMLLWCINRVAHR